jgi:hypothetical protein
MEKFTKGEWIAFYPHEVLNDGLMSVETEDGKLICKAEVYKSTVSEVTANAHLIVAAPDMYYALCEFIELVERDSSEDFLYKYQDVKRLLAKARGES